MDDLACVKMVLRSLLLTYKDGCKLHSLPGAYRELDGNNIPFRNLGYVSLAQFLQHIPDVARLGRSRDGEEVVFGVANEQTAHIQLMVMKQRKTKNRGNKSRGGHKPRSYGRPFKPSAPKAQAAVVRHMYGSSPAAHNPRTVTAKPSPPKPQKPTNLPPRMMTKQVDTLSVTVNYPQSQLQIGEAQLPLPDDSVGALVTHIQDAHNFYVSVVGSSINSIMTRIQQRQPVSAPEIVAPRSPSQLVGMFCLAQFSADNLWYRAKVTSVHNTGKFDLILFVNFVDFGNSEKKTLKQIRSITPEECEEKAQCLKCSLYGILPKEVSWSNECNRTLQRLLENKTCNVKVCRIIDDEICEVTLTVGGTVVNTHLVDHGLARSKNLEPAKLAPPDDEFPLVYVSYFEVTTAVTMRYMGENYSEALDNLEDSMQVAYQNTRYSPDAFAVNVGSVYAGLTTEDSGAVSVSRVRVLRCRENNDGKVHKVDCYLPDHGDMETMDIHQLRWLHDQFRQLPYQAVTFNLRGLEQFQSHPTVLETMVNQLLGCEFAAEFDSEDPTGKTVTLHDPNTNHNMNQLLLSSLPDSVLQQKLPEPDSSYGSDTVSVRVVNIRENGVIGVRVPGEGERRHELLENDLQQEMMKSVSILAPIPASRIRRGERVVALYEDEDGGRRWYRAVIAGMVDGVIEVEFVDYGNRATVNRQQMFLIEQLSIANRLNDLPIQRIEVVLTGVPPLGGQWTQQALDHLGSILDPEGKFHLQVDRLKESGPPDVSLFVLSDDELLSCLNDHLLETPHLFFPAPSKSSSEVRSARSDVGLTRSEVRSIRSEVRSTRSDGGSSRSDEGSTRSDDSRSSTPQDPGAGVDEQTESLRRLELKYYHERPLPRTVMIVEDGAFMAVHVAWADHPGNFACIPLDNFGDLTNLMESMNTMYNKFPRINIDILAGKMYAAYYQHQWYRVVVKDIFTEKRMVSAHFVDFGDYHSLTMDDIRLLDAVHQNIPIMSFKGRLAGVLHQRMWTPDSSFFFKSMVEGKNLYCLVMDKSELDSEGAWVELVCTNTPHDVVISTAMVTRGHATPALKMTS